MVDIAKSDQSLLLDILLSAHKALKCAESLGFVQEMFKADHIRQTCRFV